MSQVSTSIVYRNGFQKFSLAATLDTRFFSSLLASVHVKLSSLALAADASELFPSRMLHFSSPLPLQ